MEILKSLLGSKKDFLVNIFSTVHSSKVTADASKTGPYLQRVKRCEGNVQMENCDVVVNNFHAKRNVLIFIGCSL